MTNTCNYCGREGKSLNSNRQHEIRCNKNPDKISFPPKTQKYYDSIACRKTSNQYIKAKETGKEYIISDETRKKLSKSTTHYAATRWTDKTRAQHSIAMKKAVKENPDSYTKNNVCGRVKIIEYNGHNLKGSWEVLTAQWLDSQNIKWLNEVNPQPYWWNGSYHTYYPDFYLPKYDVYIEVKGYKTNRDEAKWSSFVGTLLIVDSKIVNKLQEYSITDLISAHNSTVE